MGKNRLLSRSEVLSRRLAVLAPCERAALEADLATPPGGLSACQAARVMAARRGRLRPVEADWLDGVLDSWDASDLAARLVAAVTLGAGRRPR